MAKLLKLLESKTSALAQSAKHTVPRRSVAWFYNGPTTHAVCAQDAASLLLSACTDVWRLLPRLLQPPSHPPLAPRDPALDNAPCVVEDEPHATATAATAARSAGRASEGSGVLVQEAQRAEPGVSGGAGGRRKGLAGKKGVHYSGKPAMMDDDIMVRRRRVCPFVSVGLGEHQWSVLLLAMWGSSTVCREVDGCLIFTYVPLIDAAL